MTLHQKIQWVAKQKEFSRLLGDGDFEKWGSVLASLYELKIKREEEDASMGTLYGKYAISHVVTIISDEEITDSKAVEMILAGTKGYAVMIKPHQLLNRDQEVKVSDTTKVDM